MKNLFFSLSVLFSISLFAQPSNNTCATADSIGVGSTCFSTAGNLYLATRTNPGTGSCGNRYDAWYKFKVPSYTTSVTITVTLTSSPSSLTTSNTFIELFNTSNCTLLNNWTGGCNDISSSRTYAGLTSGNIYYFRVYSTMNPSTNPTQWGYNVCATASAGSRMKEVFKQTILSGSNVLNYPWEVTYGPDDSLWITESKGYKVYKMNASNGGKRTVLDISQGSTFLPLADRTFNCQFNNGSGAQGGLAGLALHPKFLDPVSPQNYVYISYIYSSDGGSAPTGKFYTNRLVRFTYNTSTGKLGSPVSLCDTLPGSSDHNSQRMIIAPTSIGGTKYLFYAGGDMGAGQFDNRDRPNKAQNPDSYEGKILRFNLVSDGDAGLAAWIPNDNPYSSTSAVWSIGLRNNQGFAYDSTLNILYGNMHGPYSDDEINIIMPFRNYGHPLVIGYADGNYNGTTTPSTNTSVSAGAPFTDNSGNSACPAVGNETTRLAEINAAGHGLYKGPLFSAYPTPQATIASTWKTNPGNGGWYSEGWSGLDLYTHTLIPGWKKSLIAAGLKWGRLIRLKLGTAGITTMPSNLDSMNTGDTITYFQSTNRYRDLAFAPNGKDLFIVMDNSSATSGPGVGNPTVAACPGCVLKYTFLGYADNGGKSSIPTTIDVTDGTANTCNTGTTVVINAENNNLWVPITGPDGNIMAEIYANGQNLDTITSSFYLNAGAVRTKSGVKYLDRNMTITPKVQPSSPVKIRLYLSKAEYDALDADPLGGVSSISDLKILKNSDACGGAVAGTTQLINPVYSEAHGANGYMLQANISGFSSFYFGAANITLPLNLLSFTGTLNSNVTFLKWKTSNEINTSHFIVERSVDGTTFNSIGSVAANGSATSEQNYTFPDNDVTTLQSLVIYYRLKMVDIDGGFKYSAVITITLADIVGKISVMPNPVTHEARITFSAPKDGNLVYKIIDNAGRTVMQNTMQVKKAEVNTVTVDMTGFATGLYYLKVSGAGMSNSIKLQKL